MADQLDFATWRKQNGNKKKPLVVKMPPVGDVSVGNGPPIARRIVSHDFEVRFMTFCTLLPCVWFQSRGKLRPLALTMARVCARCGFVLTLLACLPVCPLLRHPLQAPATVTAPPHPTSPLAAAAAAGVAAAAAVGAVAAARVPAAARRPAVVGAEGKLLLGVPVAVPGAVAARGEGVPAAAVPGTTRCRS